jgi:hypothetical protein
MRKTILSLLLAATGALGLAGSTAALADHRDRVYVGVDDVVFTYGRPTWRYNSEPLYVVYERGYPRYYRYGPSYTRYYGPRYYGARQRDRHWRSTRYGPHHFERHRYDPYWGSYRDRGVVIEYRDWD